MFRNNLVTVIMKHPREQKFRSLIIFPILTFALTSCGTGTNSKRDQSEDAVSSTAQAEMVGTNGQLISIQSNNVRAAGYDAGTQVMTVQFHKGALYEYYGVPADLWNSFVAAQPHPWSQVGYPRLAQGGIPYKRIG